MSAPCISIDLSAVDRMSGAKIEALRGEVERQIRARCPEYVDGQKRWPMKAYCDDADIGPVFVMEFARRVFKVAYKPGEAVWRVEAGRIAPPR
jgi:hypothetical protein